jgi:ketosteroid isomerase-like protein
MSSAADETTVNHQIMQEFYRAGIEGDLDTFFGCLDPDIRLHEPPFLHYGGDYHGIGGFKAAFAAVVEFLDLSTLVMESLTVQDDRAFAVLSVHTLDGTPISLCEQWRLREGRIASGRVWWWDPEPAMARVVSAQCIKDTDS